MGDEPQLFMQPEDGPYLPVPYSPLAVASELMLRSISELRMCEESMRENPRPSLRTRMRLARRAVVERTDVWVYCLLVSLPPSSDAPSP